MFINERLSLAELTGEQYAEAVKNAARFYGEIPDGEIERLLYGEVDLYPKEKQERDMALLGRVGQKVIPTFENQNYGAPTKAFAAAFHRPCAPVCGCGFTRIGEDGRLYLIGKSEHYHASLGHGFEGYKLINNARRLGIPNATHNNTRGYITRLCEQKIIDAVNFDRDGSEKKLDRVINLETGSLAAEAGVKLMLSRFYKSELSSAVPKYAGKTPVFLVVGDRGGKKDTNYHGTTVLTQTMRGLWPDFYSELENAAIIKTVPVEINNIGDFQEKIRAYNGGPYKTAGFIHEIILMNYGATRLSEEYLKEAYRLCSSSDTPVMVDEIQSCMWYGGMFLFRRYGLDPDICIIGKGFPGGEYPASKIITTAELDSLSQFGALVTNGQEELASLAYLITMRFASQNAEIIEENGWYFHRSLCEIADGHTAVKKIEGDGLLAGITFDSIEKAAAFAHTLGDSYCIDSSAQLYKADCPPTVLLKPPLIAPREALGYICKKVGEALSALI